MQKHAYIRSLCSENLQKKNQEKYETVVINEDIEKVIDNINQKRKRNLTRTNTLKWENDALKKQARDLKRKEIKQEIENEPRTIMKIPHEMLKSDYHISNNI